MSRIRLYGTPVDSLPTPPSGAKLLFVDEDLVFKTLDADRNVVPIEADPSNATPQPIGTATPGTSTQYARGNHAHAHGNQGGGSLHAAATPTSSGFMPSTDKEYLNGLRGSGTSQGIALGIRTVTADYTATSGDFTILGDATAGPITVTLPAAAGSTRVLNVKKIDSSLNDVTIDGDASETIDGEPTQALVAQNECFTVHSSGTAWFII